MLLFLAPKGGFYILENHSLTLSICIFVFFFPKPEFYLIPPSARILAFYTPVKKWFEQFSFQGSCTEDVISLSCLCCGLASTKKWFDQFDKLESWVKLQSFKGKKWFDQFSFQGSCNEAVIRLFCLCYGLASTKNWFDRFYKLESCSEKLHLLENNCILKNMFGHWFIIMSLYKYTTA